MIAKNPVTPAGFKALEERLSLLKSKRPAAIEAISRAKEFGDLSENAEYHEARKEQSIIEAQIRDIEATLATAFVIEVSGQNGDTVKFGGTVTLEEEDSDKIIVYKIVGESEANIDKGLLSISSPLGRALINKKVGEFVEVLIPSGEKFYKILNLEFK